MTIMLSPSIHSAKAIATARTRAETAKASSFRLIQFSVVLNPEFIQLLTSDPKAAGIIAVKFPLHQASFPLQDLRVKKIEVLFAHAPSVSGFYDEYRYADKLGAYD
jgi:hypothetical protein